MIPLQKGSRMKLVLDLLALTIRSLLYFIMGTWFVGILVFVRFKQVQ